MALEREIRDDLLCTHSNHLVHEFLAIHYSCIQQLQPIDHPLLVNTPLQRIVRNLQNERLFVLYYEDTCTRAEPLLSGELKIWVLSCKDHQQYIRIGLGQPS